MLYLLKFVMAMRSSTRALDMSNRMKSIEICQDASLMWIGLMYGIHSCTLSQPHFGQVWGGEAQHLEKSEVMSLPGLPNVQSSTTRGKTPLIGVFLVSLERS
jgi:hypothetical protein